MLVWAIRTIYQQPAGVYEYGMLLHNLVICLVNLIDTLLRHIIMTDVKGNIYNKFYTNSTNVQILLVHCLRMFVFVDLYKCDCIPCINESL